jgi:DNA topoisomerase IA
MQKKSGYYIGKDYIVSWAFGHLFSLADIESYTGTEGKRWTLDCLPCFPKEFKFELKKADGKISLTTVARDTLGSTSPWLADAGDGTTLYPTT